MPHLPVLLRQTIRLLALCPGDKVIDCTVGEGGHAKEILKIICPKGKLLALDVDEENIARARKNLKEFNNTIFVNDNFVHLKDIAAQYQFGPVKAILMDLGWSMSQFEESSRGFSFLRDEPLDMRLNSKIQDTRYKNLTAAEILNGWSETDIGKILREYGEEKNWRRIAKEIIKARKIRPFKTTQDIISLISNFQFLPPQRDPARGGTISNFRIHPATKIFQALRIAVNNELENLKTALPQAIELLGVGGRLAVITFHSLEDRIVKQYFKNQKAIKLITKKPVVADAAELKENPRARSAKLRVVERL